MKLNLTEQEKQMIMEQRAIEAKHKDPYDEGSGYERGSSMLGQVLQHAIIEASKSSNEQVSNEAIKLGTYMEGKYATWDEVIEDAPYVHRIRDFIRATSRYDESLTDVAEMVDSGIKDMGKSDADFRAEEQASRNSFKPEEEWSRKTSNVDGKTYVVNNNTGDYYTEEDWESNNTEVVQANSLGWIGEDAGVESDSFNGSLPSK